MNPMIVLPVVAKPQDSTDHPDALAALLHLPKVSQSLGGDGGKDQRRRADCECPHGTGRDEAFQSPLCRTKTGGGPAKGWERLRFCELVPWCFGR